MTDHNQSHNQTIPLDDLFSAKELVALYPKILTPSTLMWQLRSRETNGLSSACIQIGKKLLISKSRYEQWLASLAGKQRAA